MAPPVQGDPDATGPYSLTNWRRCSNDRPALLKFLLKLHRPSRRPSIVWVRGLDHDNLSVRRSAHWIRGTNADNEIDELFTGDSVCAFGRVGAWVHVSYVRSGNIAITGWANYRYLGAEQPATVP